jgi:hypothetical protein
MIFISMQFVVMNPKNRSSTGEIVKALLICLYFFEWFQQMLIILYSNLACLYGSLIIDRVH